MNKNQLQSSVKHELRLAEKMLAEFSKRKKPKSLHTLRIALKKVKAATSFSRAVSGSVKRPKALQPVFLESGRIRNLQIYEALLSSLPRRPVALLARLQNEEAELTRRFLKRIPRHRKSLDDYAHSLALPLPASPTRKMKHYFKKKKKKLHTLFANPGRSNMHRCRKEMKRLIYLLEMLPAGWKKKHARSIRQLDRLQELAGRWHDTHSFLLFAGRRQLSPKQFPSQKLRLREQRQFRSLVSAYRKTQQ